MNEPVTIEMLRDQVAGRLGRWMRDCGTGLHLDAGGDPVLYQVLEPDDRVRGIIDLLGILRDAFVHSGPLPVVLGNWSRTTLTYAAVSAARLAVPLARRLGVPLEIEMDPPATTDAERELREKCVQLTPRLAEVLPEVAMRISRGIRLRRKRLGYARTAKRIHLTDVVGRRFAEWRDGAGQLLFREPLEEWLAAVADGALDRLVRELEKLRSSQAELESAGNELIAAAGTQLAEVARRALRGGTPAVRILRALPRGIPHDVWMVMRTGSVPSTRTGCALVMRRGHRSFVLQSAEGRFFYFPPAVLAAPVLCTVSDYRAMHPLLAEPGVGYNWMHPYTGQASDRSLGGLAVPERERCPLLPAMTSEERSRFGGLRRKLPSPVATDICLSDQAEMIYLLVGRVRQSMQEGREPVILEFFTGSLDLLRRGLTHGHQRNPLGPRAPLHPRAMLSPTGPEAFVGPLAERVFPYDPRLPRIPRPAPPPDECVA